MNEDRKKFLAEKAKFHVNEMNRWYKEEINFSILNSKVYEDFCFNKGFCKKPLIEVIDKDSVSAVFEKFNGKTAILNFASFKNPGGGFLNGSMAQEEALCSESTLYNVLEKFKDSFYKENLKHLNNGLYSNRALYSKDILFVRKYTKISVDVITCASPNKSAMIKNGSVSIKNIESANSKALEERARFIKAIAEYNNINTLILGAYGCGVFKQNPKEVAQIFQKTFSRTSIDNIYYAIPKGNGNLEEFKKVFED